MQNFVANFNRRTEEWTDGRTEKRTELQQVAYAGLNLSPSSNKPEDPSSKSWKIHTTVLVAVSTLVDCDFIKSHKKHDDT